MVDLQPRGDHAAIVVREAARSAAPARGLAWFLIVVGVTGLAGLAVLRVSATVNLAFVLFFVLTAIVVYADAQKAGARVSGELAVDAKARRLTRTHGFPSLGWSELALPATAVIVVEPVREIDTKRIVGSMQVACRVIAVPCEDPITAWEGVRLARAAPHGMLILDQISYDEARGVAEALCRALAWDMIDVTAEPERRAPTELDRPLIARGEALAKAIATDVPTRRPWGASSWTDPHGTHLGLRDIGLAGLILQLTLSVPALALLYLASGGNAGIPLLGAVLLVLRAGNRTIVDLTADHLAVRPLTVWLPLGDEVVLPWTEVEAVQAMTDRGMVGLRVVTDAKSAFVPTSSRAAAQWAAVQVKRYLGERAR